MYFYLWVVLALFIAVLICRQEDKRREMAVGGHSLLAGGISAFFILAILEATLSC